MRGILLALWAVGLWAQAVPEPELVRVGPGVTAPVLVKKVEPAYSKEALEAKISGAVVVEMVVSAEGVPGRIRVLRPLGYGLDEAAVEAVSQWRFMPAKREGVPARMAATIEVRFWPGKAASNPDEERRRKQYSEAYRTLTREGAGAGARGEAVRMLLELAEQGHPAAMYAVGFSKLGEAGALAEIEKDTPGGIALLEKAAAARFAPALYFQAMRRIRGDGGPGDAKEGLRLMQEAARRGSPQAQFYVGLRFEKGMDGLAADLGKAELLYRQCSYAKIAECQYNLGRVLLGHPDRHWQDPVTGVAWLERAGEGGITQARMLAARARDLMTPEQKAAVDRVKATLPR